MIARFLLSHGFSLGVSSVIAIAFAASAIAAAPAGRYTTTATTVFDNRTKLTWQRTASSTTMIWEDAKTYCASPSLSTALGGSGWRMPTLKELQSIVDYSQSASPPIDPTAFPATPPTYFWSASLVPGFDAAWVVTFSNGFTQAPLKSFLGSIYVRCVR